MVSYMDDDGRIRTKRELRSQQDQSHDERLIHLEEEVKGGWPQDPD